MKCTLRGSARDSNFHSPAFVVSSYHHHQYLTSHLWTLTSGLSPLASCLWPLTSDLPPLALSQLHLSLPTPSSDQMDQMVFPFLPTSQQDYLPSMPRCPSVLQVFTGRRHVSSDNSR
jgi:hypothetical protein